MKFNLKLVAIALVFFTAQPALYSQIQVKALAKGLFVNFKTGRIEYTFVELVDPGVEPAEYKGALPDETYCIQVRVTDAKGRLTRVEVYKADTKALVATFKVPKQGNRYQIEGFFQIPYKDFIGAEFRFLIFGTAKGLLKGWGKEIKVSRPKPSPSPCFLTMKKGYPKGSALFGGSQPPILVYQEDLGANCDVNLYWGPAEFVYANIINPFPPIDPTYGDSPLCGHEPVNTEPQKSKFDRMLIASKTEPCYRHHIVRVWKHWKDELWECKRKWVKKVNIRGKIVEVPLFEQKLGELGIHHEAVALETEHKDPCPRQPPVSPGPTSSDKTTALPKAVNLKKGDVNQVVHDGKKVFKCANAGLIGNESNCDPEAQENQWLVLYDVPNAKTMALDKVISESCAFLAKRKPPKNKAEWLKNREIVRQQLLKSLGLDPFPPRTPLNPRIVGKAEREDYYIENLIFESRPKFYVTANIYIPKKISFPAPAVLCPTGHFMEYGKNDPVVQARCIGLAKLGYVVLVYDPIGQGERRIPGNEHNMGFGSLLVGNTNEGMMVWDSMRALDYLLSRPEVDPNRIGMTGCSGGGENTFYTAALDDRVKVPVSVCFITSYDQWVRFGGEHCICNHFPGLFQHAEEFDIAGLIAPRPHLIINGTQDPIFPIAGTREAFKKAKQIYRLYNAEDKISLVEINEGHGYSQLMREAMYGWMEKWLKNKGDGSPIPEPNLKTEPPTLPDIMCLKQGKFPTKPETIVSLNQKIARNLPEKVVLPKNREEWKKASQELCKKIVKILGSFPKKTPLEPQLKGTIEQNNCTIEKIAFKSEPGIFVPGLIFLPKGLDKPPPVAIYLDDDGKTRARDSEIVKYLIQAKIAVFTVDPRGIGETQNSEHQIVTDSIMSGRHIFGQRVWDIIRAIDYLQTRKDIDKKRIAIYGKGASGLLCLFAAALDTRIKAVATERALSSFKLAIAENQAQPIYIFIPNILKIADLPQIAALVAPRPLIMLNGVDGEKKLISEETLKKTFETTTKIYQIAGAKADKLTITICPDQEVKDRIHKLFAEQLHNFR